MTLIELEGGNTINLDHLVRFRFTEAETFPATEDTIETDTPPALDLIFVNGPDLHLEGDKALDAMQAIRRAVQTGGHGQLV